MNSSLAKPIGFSSRSVCGHQPLALAQWSKKQSSRSWNHIRCQGRRGLALRSPHPSLAQGLIYSDPEVCPSRLQSTLQFAIYSKVLFCGGPSEEAGSRKRGTDIRPTEYRIVNEAAAPLPLVRSHAPGTSS